MNALYIEGRRSGYSPDDCGKTLTVGELIEILSDFDEDLPVYLRNDNGYTYGNITERTIIPSEDLEEGDHESIPDEEAFISPGDFVMLINYYRACRREGKPIL